MKEVEKAWGKEVWIANEPEYGAKLLFIDLGAKSSLHYHPIKKETFLIMQGQVLLEVDGKDYMLDSLVQPRTILPNTPHRFLGLGNESNIILEVSTHHSEEDVVRLEESHGVEQPVKV